jgi:hypothetical protein
MTDHPKAKGDRTTLAVMLGLHEAGFAVSVPFGENTRYDLIIDDGTSLARVQCKTGRLRLGGIRWATCSSYAHHPNPRMVQRDYIGEIDYFAVYCPETGRRLLDPDRRGPAEANGDPSGAARPKQPAPIHPACERLPDRPNRNRSDGYWTVTGTRWSALFE